MDRRKTKKKGLFENGVSIWAIAEYFFTTFHLENIGVEKYVTLASKIKKENPCLTSDEIVPFMTEIKIPLLHEIYSVNKGSVQNFSDIRLKVKDREIGESISVSSKYGDKELLELLINYYHIRYDFRSKEGVYGKSYSEIVSHPILFFGSNQELNFIIPKILHISVAATLKSTVAQSNLTINMAKPEVRKKIVVLDPGHGDAYDGIPATKSGFDPGNIGVDGKTAEKDIVFKISLSVKEELQKKYTVIMTREGDISNVGKRLQWRVDKAQKENADIFVSIHGNSVGNISANGREVFYWKNIDKKLSECINKELKQIKKNRGVKKVNYYVLRECSKPAALVEVGFMSNKDDLSIIKTKHKEIGQEIVAGIDTYFQGSVK